MSASQSFLSLMHCASPLLTKVAQLKEWQVDSAPQAQDYFLAEFKTFEKSMKKQSFNSTQIQDAKYALAALIDEQVLNNSSFGLDWFQYGLVNYFYQDTTAGEVFYDKFSSLKKSSQAIAGLYYSCLQMGFRGKYQFDSSNEFTTLLSDAASELSSLQQNGETIDSFSFTEIGKLPKEKSGKGFLISAFILAAVSIVLYSFLVISAQS